MSVTTAKKTADARPRQSAFWVQGAICGALLAFATPTALLLGVLLAPALATAAGTKRAWYPHALHWYFGWPPCVPLRRMCSLPQRAHKCCV